MKTLLSLIFLIALYTNSFIQTTDYYLNITVVVKSYTGEIFYFDRNNNDYYWSPRIDEQVGNPKVIKDDQGNEF